MDTRFEPYLYFQDVNRSDGLKAVSAAPMASPAMEYRTLSRHRARFKGSFSAERGHVSDYKHCDICNAALLNYTDDNSPFRRCHRGSLEIADPEVMRIAIQQEIARSR